MKAIKNKKSRMTVADEPVVASVVADVEEIKATKQVKTFPKIAAPLTTLAGTDAVATIDNLPVTPVKREEPIPASIAVADMLEIIFLEDLFDYPIIGQYNFQRMFGITRIRKHQKFMVPRDVALTLYDKHLVSVPGLVSF